MVKLQWLTYNLFFPADIDNYNFYQLIYQQLSELK